MAPGKSRPTTELNPELTTYQIAEQKQRMDRMDGKLDGIAKHLQSQDLVLQKISDGIGNKEKKTGLAGEIVSMDARVKKVENFHGVLKMGSAAVASIVAIGAAAWAAWHGAHS